MNNWRKLLLPMLISFFYLVLMIAFLPQHGSELLSFWSSEQRQQLSHLYSNSQYILGEAGEKIDDETLYLYAGMVYTQGENPTEVNFEHPPLGKYLWGVSWKYFGNPYFLNPLVVFLALLMFYLLGRQLGLPDWTLIIGQALLIILLQPSSLIRSLLDTQLFALSLTFFVLIFSKLSLFWRSLLGGIVLGMLASIKYPLPNLLPFVLVLALFSTTIKKRYFLPLSLAVAALVYLLSYWVYFASNHNLLDLIAFEKYRLSWWLNDRAQRFYLIWQVLFLGKSHAWWQGNGWHHDGGWSPLLPLTFILSLASLFATAVQNKFRLWSCCRRRSQFCLLTIYSFVFLLLYTFGSAPYARYLYLLFPIWYFLSVKFFLIKFNWKHQCKIINSR